jgi:hypothetical protein
MSEIRRIWDSPLRIIIIIHLAAATVWAIAARLDRSSFGYIFFPSQLTALLLYGTLPAMFICPVAVIAVALRRGMSWSIAYALLLESLLCFVQLGALSLLCS